MLDAILRRRALPWGGEGQIIPPAPVTETRATSPWDEGHIARVISVISSISFKVNKVMVSWPIAIIISTSLKHHIMGRLHGKRDK